MLIIIVMYRFKLDQIKALEG